jgi:uncharacterized membrane protein YkvA (DUF1232 family)
MAGPSTQEVRPKPPVAKSWKQQAQRVHKEAHAFYLVSKHRCTPWYTKLLAACSAGYLLSPVQLIPSFIPLIGFLDDFLILFLGAKVIQKLTPPDVLGECRELADAAERRRKEEIRSMTATVTSVAIATVWIGMAIIASVLMAAYFRH